MILYVCVMCNLEAKSMFSVVNTISDNIKGVSVSRFVYLGQTLIDIGSPTYQCWEYIIVRQTPVIVQDQYWGLEFKMFILLLAVFRYLSRYNLSITSHSPKQPLQYKAHYQYYILASQFLFSLFITGIV